MAKTDTNSHVMALLVGAIIERTGKQPYVTNSPNTLVMDIDLKNGYMAAVSQLVFMQWCAEYDEGNIKLVYAMINETVKSWGEMKPKAAKYVSHYTLDLGPKTAGTWGGLDTAIQSFWTNYNWEGTAVLQKPAWQPKTLKEMYEGPPEG